MNLELIQSEVSQKEKDKYFTLTHIYGVYKDGTDEFTCKAAMEKQTQKTDMHPGQRGGEGGMYGKSDMETYITMCKTDSQRKFAA